MGTARRILIVGGGIGGLATGIAARRAGVDVDLVEIRTEWKVYHVGIIVQGNFVRAMEALGIADDAVAAGFPQSGLIFEDLHGNVLMDIPGVKLASPQYPSDLGMTRPALHNVLTTNALKLGVNVRLGTTFETIESLPDRARVRFTDGTIGEYDFVVGADGLHSKVRKDLFGSQYVPRFTGQGVWRYNVPRPKELVRTNMCIGLEGGKCGFVPLSPETGYVLLVQSEPGNPRHPDDQLAEIFRGRLAVCTGKMARLRDQITDPSLVVYRPLEAQLMPPPWYRGRALLLGDAAHATTPHMGQGAAQAVEDAVVVGDLLRQGRGVPELFEAFLQRRYERCKFIFESSIQIGEWEQRPSPDANPGALTQKMLAVVSAPI